MWETHVILAQAREEGGAETADRGGGVARNSRRSNVTLAEILCGPPYAAAVRCVFFQKGHSGCSPVRSGKPGSPPGGLSGPIFQIFLNLAPWSGFLGPPGQILPLPGLDSGLLALRESTPYT